MYLYIELWSAKEAWIKLTTAEREAKLTELLTLAQQHPIEGVVPFSFRTAGPVTLFDGIVERPVVVSTEVARPTGFHYAAAWMVPTREMIKQFEDRVEGLGWWWNYFEQKNAWGVMDREGTVADMISGNRSTLGNPTTPPTGQSSQTTPTTQTTQTASPPSSSTSTQQPANDESQTHNSPSSRPTESTGRLGRTEHDVRRLQSDIEELRKDIGVIANYVKDQQKRGA